MNDFNWDAPLTPVNALIIAELGDDDMREKLLVHPAVTQDALRELVNVGDEVLAARVAASPAVRSQALFDALAAHKDESVRLRVIWNPNTPDDVLERLRKDKSRQVRRHARTAAKQRDVDRDVTAKRRRARLNGTPA